MTGLLKKDCGNICILGKGTVTHRNDIFRSVDIMGLGSSIYVFIGVVILFAVGLGFAKSTNNQINKMEV